MRGALRAAVRWATTPLGVVAIVVVLTLDAWATLAYLPQSSVLTRVVNRRYATRSPGRAIHVTVFREGHVLRIIDDGFSSAEAARAAQETPERVFMVSYRWHTESTGLWMPWARTRTGTLGVDLLARYAARASPELRARVLELLARDRRDWLGDETARVHQANYRERRVVWWGLAHDAALVPVLGLLVLGVGRLLSHIRSRRAAAARKRGVCARCGYDVRAVPRRDGIVRCPECGDEWAG